MDLKAVLERKVFSVLLLLLRRHKLFQTFFIEICHFDRRSVREAEPFMLRRNNFRGNGHFK